MKNLIAELLLKLAAKEEESKELTAQVEALEIVVTAMLRRMAEEERKDMLTGIKTAMQTATESQAANSDDASLLEAYIQKLLAHPRY